MLPPYPDSYYRATAQLLPPQSSLRGESSADVAIVGAGFTGLSAALHLLECGYDVTVLEANRIAWGASGRNGGQLGSGQRQTQEELETRLGREHARRLWCLAREGNRLVKKLITRHEIPCGFRAGALHLAWKSSHARGFQRHVAFMEKEYPDAGLRFLSRRRIRELVASERYHGGILDTHGGHLHPLAYALGLGRAVLSKGGRIHEDSRVLSYGSKSPIVLRTKAGTLRAQSLLLACNGYLESLEPRIAGRIMPIHNYIIATEPLGEMAQALIRNNYAVTDSKFVVDYYHRTPDSRLLFGGGESYSRSLRKNITALVRKPMLKVFPQLASARIDYAWGGTLAITLPRIPHFGRLGSNIFYAQGYSGLGIHMATLAGKLLAEAVAGQHERFDILAAIHLPSFPGGVLLRYPAFLLGMLYFGLRDKV